MPSQQPPTFEDEASLFSLATEYLEAAEILFRTPPVKLNVSSVVYYLLGHAAELFLKSLLHKQGVSHQELKDPKKYGHNLAKLALRAQEEGLMNGSSLLSVQEFSKTYTPKHTEYRQKVARSLPALESLLQELRTLQHRVFDHVSEFENGA